MEITLSVIAIVISLISGFFSFYTFFWTANRDRKQMTLESYNLLQEQVFDKLNLYNPSNICEIANDKTSVEYRKLSSYVARIEHFCVGVNENIYDFNTVYELSHGYFDSNYLKNRLIPIIGAKLSHSEFDYFKNIHEVWRKFEIREKKKGK